MSIKKYLDQHHTEEFWKEIFSSTEQTLVAKNQIIKIEANKLRAERVKLIMDNIEDVLEGEVKRSEIKNQMTEIKKEKKENLLRELEDIRKTKTHTSYKFLIEKDKSLLQIFQLPHILQALKEKDPEDYKVVVQKLEERLKSYPKLSGLLIEAQKGSTAPSSAENYLLYQKYIEAKELNEDDVFLLETEYWPLVTRKLEEKELGRLLCGLWRENKLEDNVLGRRAQELQKGFRQQSHFQI